MKLNIMFGPYKFSLHATIDHHGLSMYFSIYNNFVSCCLNTFYCNDAQIIEYETIDTKTSSMTIVIHKRIIPWVWG